MNAAVRKSLHWKACVFGAATLAALLASTACSPISGDGLGDPKSSDRPSATNTAGPTSSPESGQTPTAKPSPGSSGTGGNGNAAATCTEADLSISATSEDGKGKLVRHILFTATNKSDKKCNVYRYPHVQLDDARALVPEIKDSANPNEPFTTLAPGEKAYAAMVLTGPMDEAEARAMTVALQDVKAGSNVGKPIDVPLPGVDKLIWNDYVRVTHWTTASGLALRFVMKS